jgi:hypothetical protein
MNKVLITGMLGLPLILFLAIFGENILGTFVENGNDATEAQNDMLKEVVGGRGWTDPGGWSTSE